MALDVKAESGRPIPRVVLGPLKTHTQLRMAFRRVGQAVLDGKIPRRQSTPPCMR